MKWGKDLEAGSQGARELLQQKVKNELLGHWKTQKVKAFATKQ